MARPAAAKQNNQLIGPHGGNEALRGRGRENESRVQNMSAKGICQSTGWRLPALAVGLLLVMPLLAANGQENSTKAPPALTAAPAATDTAKPPEQPAAAAATTTTTASPATEAADTAAA